MLTWLLDYLSANGWSVSFVLQCLGCHYLLALAVALPPSLILTILFPRFSGSRTGASFIFMLSVFLALLSHCMADWWHFGF